MREKLEDYVCANNFEICLVFKKCLHFFLVVVNDLKEGI